MNLEDCKVGMLVLATKKSYPDVFSMEDFLRKHPLGISYILSFSEEGWVNVGDMHVPLRIFTFSPEDLISIEGGKQ